jgi:hypothetical protein
VLVASGLPASIVQGSNVAVFSNAAGTGTVVINSSGQVGIGTASPSTAFTVYTPSPAHGIRQTDGTITVETYVGGGAGWLGTFSNHPLYFYTNNQNQAMVIGTNNNVGIGTASAGTTLQVYATGTTSPLNVVTASNTVYAFITTAGQNIGTGVGATQPQMQLYHSTGGNSIYLNFFGYRQTAGSSWTGIAQRIQHVVDITSKGYIDFNPGNATDGLAFGNGSAEYVRINGSNGNVGIGLVNPQAPLSVKGVVAAGVNAYNYYNYTFPTPGLYYVILEWAGFNDTNVQDGWTVSIGGNNNPVVVHIAGSANYLRTSVVSQYVVGFGSAGSLPAGFNAANFNLRVALLCSN